jgi:hypothetical protein
MSSCEESSSAASSSGATKLGETTASCLIPPFLVSDNFEASLHRVPRLFARDLSRVLPAIEMEGLTIVPTCQRAAMDLVATGADVATEKDRLLEKVRLRDTGSTLTREEEAKTPFRGTPWRVHDLRNVWMKRWIFFCTV